jgi:hypothetical protein
MGMRFSYLVEVEVERSEGKFSGRDTLNESIIAELEGADPSTVDGDNESTYDTVSWEVSEQEPQPKGMLLVRASTLKKALSVTSAGAGTSAASAVNALRAQLRGELVAFRVRGESALRELQERHGFSEARARRALNIAWEHGLNAEPVPGGLIRIRYHGLSESAAVPRPHIFSIEEDVAESAGKRYTQGKQTGMRAEARGEENEMARTAAAQPTTRGRGRKPAPEPEPQDDNGERELDVERFLAKPLSPTMQDYVEWFESEVTPLADLRRDLPRILVLGVQLYSPYFQKSDFNVSRREARRDERAAAAAEAAPAANGRGRGRRPAAASTEPARPAPARRGRPPKAAAAQDEPPEQAAPRRGRPPKAAAAPAKPAASGRGRGRKTAASGKDAPF